MAKILIIKHGALGDFIIALGQMKLLREQHPDAQMDLVTMSPFVKIAEQTGYFENIIIDNRATWSIKEWYRICKKVLADGEYDLIYDLQSNNRTRVRYFNLVRFLSSRDIHWAMLRDKVFEMNHVAKKFAYSCGCLTKEILPFQAPLSDLSFLHGAEEHFHLLPERYVLLIPGCSPGHVYKRWPATHFGRLLQMLDAQGIPCVVLGTSAEATEVNAIAASATSAVNFLNKASLLDIPQLSMRSLAVVGNDTGPTHIASLCQMPTIGLYCTKTASSKLSGDRVHQLVAEQISDISPEQVYHELVPMLGLSEVQH